jgi:hypothetical protein
MSTAATLLLLAVLIWFAVGAFWMRLSGLSRLTAVYPNRAEATLAKVYTGYGQLGLVNTAFAILSGGNSGLRIEASRLLIPWGKASFIPWNEIAFERVQPTAFGWTTEKVRLRFSRLASVSLTLSPEYLSRLGAPFSER